MEVGPNGMINERIKLHVAWWTGGTLGLGLNLAITQRENLNNLRIFADMSEWEY